MGARQPFDRQAVHQGEVGRGVERRQRAGHGQMRGPQNVALLDLRHAGPTDSPSSRFGLDAFRQLFPADCGQRLGVVDALDGELLRQDDGGGGDRPGQAATAGLIHSRDEAVAPRARLRFHLSVGRHSNSLGAEAAASSLFG